MPTRTIRKQWWESRSSVLLKEYARMYGGTYVPAVFKGWKYTRHYVRVELPHGLGTCYVTATKPDSDSGGQSLVIGMKYKYRPRRRLEFDLFSAKRLTISLFLGRFHRTAMPDSAMNKQFRGIASHPSVLRSVLKQEGLAEALDLHRGAYIKIRLKEHKAALVYTETCKKPDAHTLESNMQLMKLFIKGLHEQGIIRQTLSSGDYRI